MNIAINKKVQSELAVPMIANGELVGVLNLESTRKHAFSPASARSLWYAANSAAVAYQMAKSGLITSNLLDICATAAQDKDGAASLKKIAAVLCFALGADDCDIWRYNRSLGRFDAAGSTRGLFEPIVRPEGWSAYIRERNRPVWVGDIEDEVHFSKLVWLTDQWVDIPPGDSSPSSINRRGAGVDTKAQLGIPISVDGECVGVAWISYKRGCLPPGLSRMCDAFSYVSQARLVLDAVQWRLEMPSQFDLRSIGNKLKAWSESGPLKFGALAVYMDGYVIHRSFHAHVW
jgi:hypothetical protein